MAQKDMVEKTLEAYNDVFADIVNVLLFNGEELVKEDELEQITLNSIYKADGKLREQERDTAKMWQKIQDNEQNTVNICIATFGVENQTEPENDMPLRTIGYDGASYRGQLYYVTDENGKRRMNTNPRYPVITLVLYFGYKKHWDKSKSLINSLSNVPDKLKPYINDYKLNLFEIAYLTDEQVSMFKSDFHIVADYFVQMRKNRNYKPSKQQFQHVKEVLQMMSVLTNDRRFEEICNSSEERREPANMCEFLDDAINKGRIEGVSEGRILEYIDLKQEDGCSEDEILKGLVKRFNLSNEKAMEYMTCKV